MFRGKKTADEGSGDLKKFKNYNERLKVRGA